MNNRYHFGISGLIIRLVVFLLLSAGTGVLATRGTWWIAAPVFLFVLISGGAIITYVNGVNKKIAFFFDTVRNEDLTLHMSENEGTASQRALNTSINRMIETISEVKIRHEHREKFYHGMLNRSDTGLIIADDEGHIEMINPAALRIAGLAYIAHMDLLKQKNKVLYDVLDKAKPGQVITAKLLNAKELQHISVKVSRLKFGDKCYRLYSINDIKAEMEENELDSWQKLIRVLTHEIMNSIAPITSMSNTLHRFFTRKSKPVNPEDIDERIIHQTLEGLEVIEQQGKGLINFVEAYRELARIPEPVFKPVNIDEFLSRMKLLIEPRLAEENVKLQITRNDNGNDLVADEKLLSQVMINILNNAIEAMNSVCEKLIRIDVLNNSHGHPVISITDNGTGISPENLERIFIPFFTTRETGSGIGLSLSRQIMRLHKGSIEVQSSPGKETTFRLVF